jgi:hypothetical protein
MAGMMRLSRTAILTLLLGALGACADLPATAPGSNAAQRPGQILRPGQVQITPDLVMTLPKPSHLGQSFEAAQLVTAHFGDRVFAFEGHLSATPDRFLLVGVDPMGQRIISITWTDDGITADKADFVPAQIRPSNILADLVMLYWPGAAVQQALEGSGALVYDEPQARRIAVAGRDIVQTRYQGTGGDRWNGSASLCNLVWGYCLDIRSEKLP